MPDLIAPHGGGEMISQAVTPAEAADFRAKLPCVAAVPVSDADLSTLYRISDGGLSPLTLLATDAGSDQVGKLLLRIEHGVYS